MSNFGGVRYGRDTLVRMPSHIGYQGMVTLLEAPLNNRPGNGSKKGNEPGHLNVRKSIKKDSEGYYLSDSTCTVALRKLQKLGYNKKPLCLECPFESCICENKNGSD